MEPAKRTYCKRRRRFLVVVLLCAAAGIQNNVQQLMFVLRYLETFRTTPTNGERRAHNEESFSACLLVMDDNHRLSEWIAYHYHVMPLRYLVVAVDPHSRTSPKAFLDRWRPFMEIDEWTDTDFTKDTLMIDVETDSLNDKKIKHRNRQGQFYHACTKHLQAKNRTWTSYHDIDEFMSINSDVVGKNESDSLMRQPGAVLRMVHQQSSVPGAEWYKYFSQGPCLTIARTLFGAVESTDDQVNHLVPDFFDGRQFDTLRYRYRATPRSGNDGLAKSIIDVSRVEPHHFKGRTPRTSIHRPLGACPHAWVKYNSLPLGIHHYLGSWEAFSFREDARKGTLRTREKWLERSILDKGGVDDEVRPWIAGFVANVGPAASKYLLQDAGLPPGYRKFENETAEWRSVN